MHAGLALTMEMQQSFLPPQTINEEILIRQRTQNVAGPRQYNQHLAGVPQARLPMTRPIQESRNGEIESVRTTRPMEPAPAAAVAATPTAEAAHHWSGAEGWHDNVTSSPVKSNNVSSSRVKSWTLGIEKSKRIGQSGKKLWISRIHNRMVYRAGAFLRPISECIPECR